MFKKIALAATTAVALAAPAQADTNDLLRGIVGVVILNEIIKNADTVNVNTYPSHTHRSHRHQPQRGEICYTEIDETRNWIVIHQMDCYGARVSTSRHRKY